MLRCGFENTTTNVVLYRRCSTSEQKKSGLGLEAQTLAMTDFCEREGFTVIQEFTEAKSGKDNQRPELAKALELAKANNAFVVVAKLCRLSRRVSYISKLMETGVPFIVSELGRDVDPMVLHLFAAYAESEAARISRRTKEALAVKKAQGFALGNPDMDAMRAKGVASIKKGADAFAWEMKPMVEDVQRP